MGVGGWGGVSTRVPRTCGSRGMREVRASIPRINGSRGMGRK